MAFFRQPAAALGMYFEVAALLSTLLLLSRAVLFSHAADPDPMQDFCVADFGSKTNVPPMNGYACKSRAFVTSKDFLFTGLRSPGDVSVTGTNATVTYALVQQFPGVNTQQISHVRLDFAPGGVLPPHTHPLATETIYVVEGTIYTGFISHDNKLYAETLQKGDVYIFPRATLHFQINVGDVPAVSFNSFNAQFPGLLLSANQLFETNIDPAVLMKAFGTDEATVKSLTASVPRFWG